MPDSSRFRPALTLGATLVATALLLAACSSASTPTSTSRSSANGGGVVVKIVNFKFVPADFSVKPGETVTITNDDSVPHTFTALPHSSPFGAFDTGTINPGQTVTITAPRKPGTFGYLCTLHPFMTGALTVAG